MLARRLDSRCLGTSRSRTAAATRTHENTGERAGGGGGRARRNLLALFTLLGAAIFACEGDHDALKKQNPPATGGAAGSAADAAPDVELDVGPDVFVEPTGPSKLTLLHGVVDATRIAYCFARVVDGLPEPVLGSPLPAAGLSWGAALAVSELPGLDWAKDDVLPIVVAGDFSLLGGKSCADAIALAESFAQPDADAAVDDADASPYDAGDAPSDAPSDAPAVLPPPPKLRAAELPVLPAGTLSMGWSLLFAATGCIGGPAFSDPLETYVCGAAYTPSTPTLTPVLVPLSRVTKPGAMGLMVVNAALAADPISVTSAHPKGSSIPGISVAYNVVFGSVAPRPPLLGYSATGFGAPISASLLEVTSQNASSPFYTQTWKDALAFGELSDVLDEATYALVLVGPRPNNPAAKWWNGPRVTALPAAP